MLFCRRLREPRGPAPVRYRTRRRADRHQSHAPLDLPGIGRNLHEQPCLDVGYEGSGDLIQQMELHQAETGWQPDEQVIAKFPSAGCRQGFDLHIYPVGGRVKDTSQWFWILGASS